MSVRPGMRPHPSQLVLSLVAEMAELLQRATARSVAIARSPHARELADRLTHYRARFEGGQPWATLERWRLIKVGQQAEQDDPAKAVLDRVLSAEYAGELLAKEASAAQLGAPPWAPVRGGYVDPRAHAALVEYVDLLWRDAAATARAALNEEGSAEHSDALQELRGDIADARALLRERPWIEEA